MPTVFSHAAIGWALVQSARPWLPKPAVEPLAVTAAALAMLPDADVFAFALGIPYEAAFGHRGFSHSLAFALLAGLAAFGGMSLASRIKGAEARPGILTALLLVVATASHGLLDMLTNGGLGVALFAPIDLERHFFPITPIPVSPIGVDASLAYVVVWELALLWPLAVAAWVASREEWSRTARVGSITVAALVFVVAHAIRGGMASFG